jgi:hypothetical protein
MRLGGPHSQSGLRGERSWSYRELNCDSSIVQPAELLYRLSLACSLLASRGKGEVAAWNNITWRPAWGDIGARIIKLDPLWISVGLNPPRNELRYRSDEAVRKPDSVWWSWKMRKIRGPLREWTRDSSADLRRLDSPLNVVSVKSRVIILSKAKS